MICERCIYDDKIPYITFNENGVCNYCEDYDSMCLEYPTGESGKIILDKLVNQIKKDGEGKKYDAVIGVSGGCDSSYMLHFVKKELGLRVLAAHFDNTWNSNIAVSNIYKMTKALDIDLYTHVCDNKQYNDIFKSCLLAGIPESDLAADIGLATTHYLACEKFGIKYIFEGHDFRSEGITPQGWVYMDARYIKSVHDEFGTNKNIDTFPNLWLYKWMKWILIDKIKKIRPLYYLDYDKETVKKFLIKEYNWEWYQGHHMENRTSYFANNYYLPVKFGIDLRNVEFSALVRSKQITRNEALNKMIKAEFFDMSIIEEIKKRLNFHGEEFFEMMISPKKSYRDYKTYKKLFERMRPLFYLMYKANLVPKSFYMKFTRRYE